MNAHFQSLLFSSLKRFFWYLSSARISIVQQEPWLQKQQLFWLQSDFCNPLKNCESCSLSSLLQGGKDKRILIAYTIHWVWQRSPHLLKSTQTNRWPTVPIAPRYVCQTPWVQAENLAQFIFLSTITTVSAVTRQAYWITNDHLFSSIDTGI